MIGVRGVRVTVFNATFNNLSVISWRSRHNWEAVVNYEPKYICQYHHLSLTESKWQNTFQQDFDISENTNWKIRGDDSLKTHNLIIYSLDDSDFVQSLNTNCRLKCYIWVVKYKLHTLERLVYQYQCGKYIIGKVLRFSIGSGRKLTIVVKFWSKYMNEEMRQRSCFCCIYYLKLLGSKLMCGLLINRTSSIYHCYMVIHFICTYIV